MIWSRKEKITHGRLGPLLIPPIPAKKEFISMMEILKDAEKFDSEGESDVSKKLLKILCEYIEVYSSTL